MKLLHGKLTYANVVSTLCLFLLVAGGTAFAASQLGKNTVGSKQLKKNAVTAAKIRNSAVTTSKVKDGAITGPKVNLGSLGTVPNAAHATISDTATSLPPEAVHLIGAPGEPPFLNDASNPPAPGPNSFVPAGFYKDRQGIVHLQGTVKSNSDETTIFRLPPGYRPPRNSFALFGTATEVLIAGSDTAIEGQDIGGDVRSPVAKGELVRLDGITFLAGS